MSDSANLLCMRLLAYNIQFLKHIAHLSSRVLISNLLFLERIHSQILKLMTLAKQF